MTLSASQKMQQNARVRHTKDHLLIFYNCIQTAFHSTDDRYGSWGSPNEVALYCTREATSASFQATIARFVHENNSCVSQDPAGRVGQLVHLIGPRGLVHDESFLWYSELLIDVRQGVRISRCFYNEVYNMLLAHAGYTLQKPDGSTQAITTEVDTSILTAVASSKHTGASGPVPPFSACTEQKKKVIHILLRYLGVSEQHPDGTVAQGGASMGDRLPPDHAGISASGAEITLTPAAEAYYDRYGYDVLVEGAAMVDPQAIRARALCNVDQLVCAAAVQTANRCSSMCGLLSRELGIVHPLVELPGIAEERVHALGERLASAAGKAEAEAYIGRYRGQTRGEQQQTGGQHTRGSRWLNSNASRFGMQLVSKRHRVPGGDKRKREYDWKTVRTKGARLA